MPWLNAGFAVKLLVDLSDPSRDGRPCQPGFALALAGQTHVLESQFSPNGLKFKAANVAEVFERIIAIYGLDLDLLGRQIRLPVSVDDGVYDFLTRCQYRCRGTQPNATQERIHRNQVSRVANQILSIVCVMPESIDQEACIFTDKIGIQLLPVDKYFSQQLA